MHGPGPRWWRCCAATRRSPTTSLRPWRPAADAHGGPRRWGGGPPPATREHGLPDVVAAAWAGGGAAADFVLGLCSGAAGVEGALHDAEAAAAEREQARGALEVTVERLGAELRAATERLGAVEDELRDERSGRRNRDDAAAADLAAERDATRRAAADLESARERIRRLDEQHSHDTRRSAELEQQVRDARAALQALREGDAAVVAQRDELRALTNAATRVAEGLIALDRAVQAAPQRGAVTAAATREPDEVVLPKAPQRRTPMVVPGGHVADTPAGAAAMFAATPNFLYVVDGYNVARAATPDASLQVMRDRLVAHLEQVARRYGCDVVVCFDGNEDAAFRANARRNGVRVLFSASDQEADDLVVATVADCRKAVAVVVATSDGWLRDQVVALGATVLSKETAIGLHQRASRR